MKNFNFRWHLGHCNEAYLPTQRGFESHLGYWVGLQYYYNKTYYGYDFHEGLDLVTDPTAKEIYSTVSESFPIEKLMLKNAPLFVDLYIFLQQISH